MMNRECIAAKDAFDLMESFLDWEVLSALTA